MAGEVLLLPTIFLKFMQRPADPICRHKIVVNGQERVCDCRKEEHCVVEVASNSFILICPDEVPISGIPLEKFKAGEIVDFFDLDAGEVKGTPISRRRVNDYLKPLWSRTKPPALAQK